MTSKPWPSSPLTDDQFERIVHAVTFNFPGLYSAMREQNGLPAAAFLTEAEADDVIAAIEIWEAECYAASLEVAS